MATLTTKRKIFETLSGSSFLLGMLTSKLQLLPVSIAKPFFNLASLVLSLTGYSFWYIASYFIPDHKPKYSEWYGFAAFKEQNSMAAFFGILGTFISMGAIALPFLTIPAVWLLFASNVIWAVGEYHKYKNPLKGELYAESHQKSYFSYALVMSAIGLIGAITATLIFAFPSIAIPAFIVSGILSLALGLLGAQLWLDFTFGDHKKMIFGENSYDKINNELGVNKQLEVDPLCSPTHSQQLFEYKPNSNYNETDLKEYNPDLSFPTPTCNLP